MLTMLSAVWMGMIAFGALLVGGCPPARIFTRPLPPEEDSWKMEFELEPEPIPVQVQWVDEYWDDIEEFKLMEPELPVTPYSDMMPVPLDKNHKAFPVALTAAESKAAQARWEACLNRPALMPDRPNLQLPNTVLLPPDMMPQAKVKDEELVFTCYNGKVIPIGNPNRRAEKTTSY